MSPAARQPRAGSRAAGAVAAVAVLQVVATVVLALIWFFEVVFGSAACGPGCDPAAVDRAGRVFLLAIVASYTISAVAFVVAWRTSRDLSWVPLLATVVLLGGFFLTRSFAG